MLHNNRMTTEESKSFCNTTLGQNPTFNPEIPLIFIFQKCESCEKCDFRIVNLVKNEISEM